MAADNILIVKISFESHDATCHGLLYLPGEKESAAPCIVMATGFSATMDWILPDFAKKFAEKGFAVLTFDYRHFGESEGKPRQVIDIKKQRADLKNAIAFARNYEGIDKNKIALWGTSLGGSHVIEIASNDPGIFAVIGNMPAIDAVKGANTRAKMKKANVTIVKAFIATAKLVWAALLDKLKRFFGLCPKYIEVYGEPGKAVFTDPAIAGNFKNLMEKSSSWINKVAAGFLFNLPRYKDGTFERIKAPLLITLASVDVEISSEFIKQKSSRSSSVEIKEYPVNQFSMYHGEAFNQVVNDQLYFLNSCLRGS
jgi:dienelactone hydrolase